MSGIGARRDMAEREAKRRQLLARNLRNLADPSLDGADLVRIAADMVGIHATDLRAALAEISWQLDPERTLL